LVADLRAVLRSKNTASIIVTHDPSVERHADRVVQSRDGRASVEGRWIAAMVGVATSSPRTKHPLKALSMCDEHTRESIGRRLGRSITADDVVEVLDQAKAERGAPQYIRMDNGPEMIAGAIRDWCRLSGTGTLYIEPGSPWENPFVESFNARLRDELFNREIFSSVFEARVLYDDWCQVYNNFRPHSSIGYLAPAAFAALLLGQPSAALPTP